MRVLLTFCLVGLLALAQAAPLQGQSPQQISETGSSLLYPVIQQWAAAYKAVAPSINITTASTGSGAGIQAATSGAAAIGGSDAYLSPDDLKKGGLLNIALTISAQTVTYNVPEVGDQRLNLSGAILAGIYRGTITMWDDPAISAVNLHTTGKQ